MERITGIIEEIVFHNEDNGYTVIEVSSEEGTITCVGSMFRVSIGEEITIEGEYTMHNVYGKQFQVKEYTTVIPSEKSAFERYLGSGAVKGIGPILASKIVAKFAENTFDIIEKEPERLAEIKGISDKKAREIGEKFFSQRQLRQGIMFLQQYNISLTYAVKIFDKYKDKIYSVIKENPYKIAEDIKGVGFKLADSIAISVGIAKDNPYRICAGIRHVLLEATMNGNLFLTKEKLSYATSELLEENIELINNNLIDMQLNGVIVVKEKQDRTIVYLEYYYKMEEYLAHKICGILNSNVRQVTDVSKFIKAFEKDEQIILDDIQKKALTIGSKYPMMIVTGGPGTGKTTTINALIRLFKKDGLSISLAAPTGRAAKRMTETSRFEAKTIHRLLEISFSTSDNQTFERNEDMPLEADVIIIDEVSMLDTVLFYHLLKAIPLGARLVLVGDKDQLPSVGPGNVLKDMILQKKLIPTVVLKRIYRQNEESAIVENAHKINQGMMIDYKGKKDFFYIKRNRNEQIIQEVITLAKERLPKYMKTTFFESIQVLTPMRKGGLGSIELNKKLQEVINKKSNRKSEKIYRENIFREGDKVMQIVNDYNIKWEIVNKYGIKLDFGTGVYNGDMGIIKSINNYSEELIVEFDDDKKVTYDFKQLDELELAYAVTIHKSQGSEYPIVVIPIFRGPKMLLSRNLLYTAVTRAKSLVVLVGDSDILKFMIENNREIERNSSLNEHIEESALIHEVEELKDV